MTNWAFSHGTECPLPQPWVLSPVCVTDCFIPATNVIFIDYTLRGANYQDINLIPSLPVESTASEFIAAAKKSTRVSSFRTKMSKLDMLPTDIQ
jgi:hypothetical protein